MVFCAVSLKHAIYDPLAVICFYLLNEGITFALVRLSHFRHFIVIVKIRKVTNEMEQTSHSQISAPLPILSTQRGVTCLT